MTEADQITAAVAQARARLPNLPDDYGPRAIAAGMTAARVKGDLVDMMSQNPRERGRALMRAECERQGMFKARGSDATTTAPAGTPASGKALMADLVRRQGMTPRE